MEDKDNNEIGYMKVTPGPAILKDFDKWIGNTTRTQGFIDLWRHAVNTGFNPNNIQPERTDEDTVFKVEKRK